MLDYVREHVPEPRTAPLAGNSIATDRAFLARDMPELDGHLHYRMVDVSSIKELCRRWYPRVFYAKPEKGLAHRALADISESIRELDYYRRTAFVPPPGPTTEEAQAAAALAHRLRCAARCGVTSLRRLVSGGGRPLDGGCSSAGRAPGCGPGSRGFESRHSPHFDQSGAMTLALTWDQVLTWRMERQFLDRPPDLDVPQIVRRLAGVQAQVASYAEHAIAIRNADAGSGVAAALADRTIVKTWAQRGTLHRGLPGWRRPGC